jgi:DNA-binding response OmpR family regulator
LKKDAKARVLMIDDEVELTKVMKLGLEHKDIVVDVYNDPLKAISDFRKGVYDVVILDVRMPLISGFEVYGRLREVDSEVPVCFLSAVDDSEIEFMKLFPGDKVPTFLTKPVSIALLSQEAERLAGHGGPGFRRPGMLQAVPHGFRDALMGTLNRHVFY